MNTFRVERLQVFPMILALSLAFPNHSWARLPDDLTTDIRKTAATFSKLLTSFHYTPQRRLLTDRYLDLMIAKHTLQAHPQVDRGEVENLLALQFSLYTNNSLELATNSPEAENHVQNTECSSNINDSTFSKIQNTAIEAKTLSLLSSAEIKILITTLNGKITGDLLNLNFKCDGQNYNIPLHVFSTGQNIVFKLPGVSTDGFADASCLVLWVYPKKNSSTISWLGTQNACPIPETKGGTCLLTFAEAIARSLKLAKISLSDTAMAKCSKNQKDTSLRMLNLFQGGVGWYERNGYLPDQNLVKYQTLMSEFKNYKLSDLIKHIKASFQNPGRPRLYLKPSVELLERKMTEFSNTETNTDKVAAFMSWLWDNNCAEYIDLEKLLFDKNGVADPTFMSLFPYLEGDQIKPLK